MNPPSFAFPHISLAALEEELAREERARRGFYPDRVAKGRMTAQEQAEGLAMVAAWRQDAARLNRAPGAAIAPATHGLSWHARRDGLLAELAQRAKVYPRWVATCRMTEDQARHRTDCLLALLDLYEDGYDFCAPNGERGCDALADAQRTPAQREAWVSWCLIQHHRAAEGRGSPDCARMAALNLQREGIAPPPTTQQELAL